MAELLLFRVGRELFAAELAAVEEAVDLTAVRAVDRIPGTDSPVRGIFTLRGALVPLLSPAGPLRVTPEAGETALIVRDGAARVALVVDDVEDVLTVGQEELRPLPAASARDAAVLRGIIRRGTVLVAVLDLDALIAACRGSPQPEAA
jgi:purine-binding chemotaxis protein CheW